MRYRTVLLDLDGTLIDTNELIMRSFEHTFEQVLPGRYTRKDVLDIWGRPLVDQMRCFDADRVDELVRVYREYNLAHHDELVQVFPGVTDTVRALKVEGCQLGVVTSKSRASALRGLAIAGIDDVIETLVGVEDSEKHKPDPEPVQIGMERLGAKPESTVMVGDSPADMAAARGAGVASAGVAWSWRLEALRTYNPDHMLETMDELLTIVKGNR